MIFFFFSTKAPSNQHVKILSNWFESRNKKRNKSINQSINQNKNLNSLFLNAIILFWWFVRDVAVKLQAKQLSQLCPVFRAEISLRQINGLHMTSLTTIFDITCTNERLSLAESCAQRAHACIYDSEWCHVQCIYWHQHEWTLRWVCLQIET